MTLKRVRLEFEIEGGEDEQHVRRCMNVGAVYGAIHEIGQEVFRPARKHGYPDQDIENLVNKLDDLANDDAGIPKDASNHAPGATDLIAKLEEKFYAILREHEVELD